MPNIAFSAVPFGGEPHPRPDLRNLVLSPDADVTLPETVRSEVPTECPLLQLRPRGKVNCIATEYIGEMMIVIDDLRCATCKLAGDSIANNGICAHPDVVRTLQRTK